LEVESETVGEGVREYIRVLRLLEDYSLIDVSLAVEKGLKIRAHRRDAIILFLLPDHSWHWSGRDHLAWVQVASPDLSAYRTLLSPEGGS
jgi:hypothetical protein